MWPPRLQVIWSTPISPRQSVGVTARRLTAWRQFGRDAWRAAFRQATKPVDDVIRLAQRATDLALKAIAISDRRNGELFDLILTSRDFLFRSVGAGDIRAGRRERPNADESAERHAIVTCARRSERKRKGNG